MIDRAMVMKEMSGREYRDAIEMLESMIYIFRHRKEARLINVTYKLSGSNCPAVGT